MAKLSLISRELEKRRRTRLILFSILTFVVLMTTAQVLVHQLRTPSPLPSNVLIFALVNINVVLLLTLILLVFRNLFKIYLEHRSNILGSRFLVKLVVAFVGLTLLPALVLFVVASNFIITSIESWFNIQVEESLQRSLEIAQTYYRNAQEGTLAFARQISQQMIEADLLGQEDVGVLQQFLSDKLKEYHLSTIQVFSKEGRELASALAKKAPGRAGASLVRIVQRGLKGETFALVQSIPEGDLILGIVPVAPRWRSSDVSGVVVATSFVPEGLLAKANDITTGFKDYKVLKMLKGPIKGQAILLFLIMTLVIIFAAIWVGVHLARGITVPIQQLAEGTRAVAAGNLNFKVEVKADDEIGILVDSFNTMTGDLLKGQAKLEAANLELQKSNEELQRRRAYMETVLQNIAAGVLSLDQRGVINTVNQAALRILDLSPKEVLYQPYQRLFQEEAFAPIRLLLERVVSEERGVIDEQVLLRRNGRVMTLAVSASHLKDGEENHLGMVVVLEDITQLIRAQQALAWREVARRIAHEIKNPLTPIKLSAQRLRKKFFDRSPDYERVFDESTRTIIQEVDGLKDLVDEFSRYARMPSSNPRSGDLHGVVEKVVALYAGLSRRVKIITDLDPSLPWVDLDPEQMKRALINLVDNAVAAIEGEGEIVIRTRPLPDHSRVLLEVTDTGCGIPAQDKERLFLPYFSTKRSGTGLGLAIVYRIVAEHGGSIRAEDNVPRGTRMIVELPALPRT
ncbi:MAG: PAS domain S-box protein [candidate division NC10 bacterium]|nr:PAS domain S-box protein [candidate division NC10 bacterium]